MLIEKPHLWSPDSPYLYTAETSLIRNGVKCDCYATRFGVRKIEYVPEKGFFLNGQRTMFKGVCNHHDLGPLGAAVNRSALKHQLSLLKDMDEVKRRALSRDLTNVVRQIKEMHEEDEEQDVSIGIDRVLGLYKISNSRRWYDKVSILSYALKTMSTLPREDFYNIMEGITTSLSA